MSSSGLLWADDDDDEFTNVVSLSSASYVVCIGFKRAAFLSYGIKSSRDTTVCQVTVFYVDGFLLHAYSQQHIIHFGLCSTLISRSLALISNCKYII
jgi:hypothetical protein